VLCEWFVVARKGIESVSANFVSSWMSSGSIVSGLKLVERCLMRGVSGRKGGRREDIRAAGDGSE
jgi:hypothetical protein